MRHPQSTPRDVLCQPTWADAVADAAGLSDYSAAVPRAALARALLLAAALTTSVSAVARRATGRGRETVRTGLAASLPDDPDVLADRLVRGFHRSAGRGLRRARVRVAIDTHRRPYYGDHARTPGATGGKAEASTAWGFGYATAVALTRGRRHTLGLTAIRRGDTMGAVADRLLAQVGRSGVRVRVVLLDRGFYAAGVVNALRRRGLRFVIPVVRRGAAVGRAFARGAAGATAHTLRDRRSRAGSAGVTVVSVPGADRRPWVFACSDGRFTPARLVGLYRRRFGVESSYRQLGECLGRTTARCPVYRLLLVGVSLLIREWWVGTGGRSRVVEWRVALILALATPPATPTGAQDPAPDTQPPAG